MKVFVNQDYVEGPWGGGNAFVKAMLSHKKDITFTNKFTDLAKGDIDTFFVTNLDGHGGQLNIIQVFDIARSMNAKIILRVNENDARKGTTGVDKRFADVMVNCDHVVFVSNWLKKYYEDKFDLSSISSSVIYNGVDHDVFKQCDKEMKFNNSKINIVSAHWSDNYLKGQDITEFLDEFVGNNSNEFTFSFIGRTKAKLNNSLHIQPLYGHELGKMLSKFDVNINGSRFDPGPNSVLESLACNVPTYVHEDGGGAVEFAGDDHVFKNVIELSQILLSKSFLMNTTRLLSWNESISQYTESIKSVVSL